MEIGWKSVTVNDIKYMIVRGIPPRMPGVVYSLQPFSAEPAYSQARLKSPAAIEKADQIRRPDHRRHRLHAAEPGGDGGIVYSAG